MSADVEPADLAAFLRDVAEATTLQQRTVSDQTKNGAARWCHSAVALDGVRSPYLEQPGVASTTFLEVPRPGHQPVPPGQGGHVDADELRRYLLEQSRWDRHKDLYDGLFAARTPPDAMELVVAIGLLVGGTEQGELRRHLAAGPAEVTLDRGTGLLRVDLSDAMFQEINWTPAEVRSRLVEQGGGLDELAEAQSQHEVETAVQRMAASFGTAGRVLTDPFAPADTETFGIGAFPAVLLRKRDTSSLLQLLHDMAGDMAAGGFVSDPFKMLASPAFRPPHRPVRNERAALPLPANLEQRSMIDRARHEPHLVVQGPPGTGKTHTIANLAAVLMAEGRRVLVTAENERALTEVQSKLPPPMRPLMLPMLRERGSGSLQASVNALTSRAGGGEIEADRERDIEERMRRLLDIEARVAMAEHQLHQVSQADRADRTFGQTTMRLAGHQQALAGRRDHLNLVDRFLGPSGRALAADGAAIAQLSAVVSDAHYQMRQFRFPEGLKEPGELSTWLQDHRQQLAILSDPTGYDHSQLIDRLDEIARLANMLQGLPPAEWSAITRSSEEYAEASRECAAVRGIDRSVTVEPQTGRASTQKTLEAYLALDGERFDQPVADLLAMHARARKHVETAPAVGAFAAHQRAEQLTRSCEAALDALTRDRSGLLRDHVVDHTGQGRSAVDTLVQEATDLLPWSRAPVGLPIQVADGAPPPHELLRQAEGLAAHLETGGKLNRRLGMPRPVKEATELLDHVRVDGSPIDTVEEANRAVEFFRHRKTLALVDAWAHQQSIQPPPGVSHHEWLTAISNIPLDSQQVRHALTLAGELVGFPDRATVIEPAEILRTALATVSQELLSALSNLAATVERQEAELRIAGKEVRSRLEAERALASLRAWELHERHRRLLPSPWEERCSAIALDLDILAVMLAVCGAAAAVPGEARTAELSPSAVNRIAERAQIDLRRNQLIQEHERVVGGLRRSLAACVPMSPATRAIDRAVADENSNDYRAAVRELDREREMADLAARLECSRSRVAEVHPRLIAAFDTGDEGAATALEALEELQILRDHRAVVARWTEEISSSEAIHRELAELHGQLRRAEEELASLRCWSSAIDRIQSRRELRSALSALTIAMDKVPKTRTAKSYPARMRALRSATKDAAPAIPCWIMPVDRVAEVLGYPRGEDRFDVVIVDEASQAWFPAMFLYAIADQVIVVGDDLQTSPSQVINEAEIRSMAAEHIAGHRLADQAGSDLSLYDVAAVMTGPETMVDHFRCVPEIIDLSNRLSYGPKGKRLLPSRLREPGSLEPIKHVHVLGARRGKAAANAEEVAAIVEQVARCHADPAYAGMDFGVVVVGAAPNAHLKLLRTRLLDELGGPAMEQRNLEVGSPSQFQGAERNVMFLSLVDVPTETERLRIWPHEHTGLNRKRVQQLNVAVSRARDQLWIFRSFELSALPDGDARAIILHAGVPALASLKHELEACDSNFERDVVVALAEADPTLAIRTQVEAMGFRIDIVAEDLNGNRLAIECDGDRWHMGEDSIRRDLYRQRTLESIGWRFDRFLASEWYADPAGRIGVILERLRSRAPIGATAQPASHALPAAAEAATDIERGDRTSEAWGSHGSRFAQDDAGVLSRPGRDDGAWNDIDGQDHGDDWDDEPQDDGHETVARQARQSLTPGSGLKPLNRPVPTTIRDLEIDPNRRARAQINRLLAANGILGPVGPDRAGDAPELLETLKCDECGAVWRRVRVRGRKPRLCSDCR